MALTAGQPDYDSLKRKFQLGANERSEKGDTDWLSVEAFSTRVSYDIAQQAGQPLAPVAIRQRRLRQGKCRRLLRAEPTVPQR